MTSRQSGEINPQIFSSIEIVNFLVYIDQQGACLKSGSAYFLKMNDVYLILPINTYHQMMNWAVVTKIDCGNN